MKKGDHYPPVLFYTTTSDDRVGPAQARKMAAKMQGMGYKNVGSTRTPKAATAPARTTSRRALMHALAYDFLWDQLK